MLLLPVLAAAAATAGVITIIEGDATVIRDAERFAAAEGLRLRADDIVSTGDGTRLTRIELDDGKAIDLGPATQVMLQPRALGERGPTLYVAAGWAKLSNAPKGAAPAAPAALASPRLDALQITGTAIVRVGKDEVWLFAESGTADAVRRRDGKFAAPQPLKDGDSFVQRGAAPPTVSRLPPADLLAQMPRPFVDTLPRRAARFANSVVEPSKPVDVNYGDVATWVNGEPALRAAFVPRLAQRAKEPRFRSALVAELKLHPEWQRVLFPPPPPKPPEDTTARRALPAAAEGGPPQNEASAPQAPASTVQ